jgi:penicillin G amidase
MATTVPVYSRPRSAFWRVGGIILLLFLLAIAGLLFWCYWVARSALPQLDGKLTVPGLTVPVTVTRDVHGAPTIEAGNLQDLFFAQGYVTAQDRLFQMDGMRRFAAGELAEIVGLGQLEHDRQQRILGIREAARKTVETMSSDDRARFDTYARGVNAFIESHRDHLPIEFRILHYSPQPWSAEDSALIGAYMVEDLTTSPRHALTREKILAKIGPDLTADLYVNSSWRDRPPTVARPTMDQNQNPDGDDDDDDEDSGPDSSVARATLHRGPADAFGTSIGRTVLRGLMSTQNDIAFFFGSAPLFFDDSPSMLGSNDWVVSGAHTVSGKPLLSNDMHLGFQMPNLWYEAHLRCVATGCTPNPTFDVAGVTLPGYPFVIVGHNQRVAWGFTNIGPTIEDVYIENFNASGQYQTPSGWKDPEHRRDVIHVKGRADVAFDVQLTRHGPIVTDLVPGETRKLALRWTLYEGPRSPFFAIDSAANWDEFQKAFSEFDAPGQNVVYADVDGNIGYHATGKVPIRRTGDGSLPEDGSNDDHEWVGYIPFDKLPSIFNPESGIIGTANGRIAPSKYPYSISTEWEAPWRTDRIYRVLASGKKFAPADMLALQTDIYSDLDRLFGERFVYAVDHAKNPSARAKAAADILRQWDGRMTADSAAPTIVEESREELTRLLLEPKLGVAPKDPAQLKSTLSWKSYHWMMETVWLDNVVEHQLKRWLPDRYATFDELLVAAVESAVDASAAPRDLNTWKWGPANSIDIQNPVLGQIPLLNHWTGPGRREASGSDYTVKAMHRTYGPSERITDDLANLDRSSLNLVTGEAGNFLSPYYMDQWDAWYTGFTFPWPFSPVALQQASTHKLELEPTK